MKTIGFHIGRIGFYLYLQSLWKYKQFYLTPGVMVEGVKGHDVFLDIEIKLLCFFRWFPADMDKNQKKLLTL